MVVMPMKVGAPGLVGARLCFWNYSFGVIKGPIFAEGAYFIEYFTYCDCYHATAAKLFACVTRSLPRCFGRSLTSRMTGWMGFLTERAGSRHFLFLATIGCSMLFSKPNISYLPLAVCLVVCDCTAQTCFVVFQQGLDTPAPCTPCFGLSPPISR